MKSEKRKGDLLTFTQFGLCRADLQSISTDIKHPVPKTECRFYAGGKHLKGRVAVPGLSVLPSIQTRLSRSRTSLLPGFNSEEQDSVIYNILQCPLYKILLPTALRNLHAIPEWSSEVNYKLQEIVFPLVL